LDNSSDLLPTERVALAMWLLMQQPMTTRNLALRLGMSIEGARVMLTKMSRVVPIHWHEGRWQVCHENTTGSG